MTVTTGEPRVGRFPLFVFFMALLAAVRLIGLTRSAVDLYVDEAQYWSWSRDLALGYFSKPPLIAWTIAATDLACGSGEACVRSFAPLFYFGTGLAVFAIGRHLYDERTGFWAGILAAFAPGLIFSARIASTDVPLLFFLSLAILAIVKLRSRGGPGWSILLAIAFGLGMLSKYAMAYLLPGLLLAALVDRDSRALMARPALWLALAGGFLLFVPNLIWNLRHGLVTIQHVGDNAGRAFAFDPVEGGEFLASQFAVAGPVVFFVLIVLIARLRSSALVPADRMLVALALPPLAIIAGLAFLGSSNANWAVTAYIPAFVVTAAVLLRRKQRAALAGSLVLGIVLQGVILAGDTFADRITLPKALGGDVYRRTMGGEALGAEVRALAAAGGIRSVVAESRADAAALLYYLRDTGIEVFVWPPPSAPRHHFELTRPLASGVAGPLLAITRCAGPDRFGPFFAEISELPAFVVRHGPTRSTGFHAFRLEGPTAAPGPPGPCR